jgi:ankyrin repeat protein
MKPVFLAVLMVIAVPACAATPPPPPAEDEGWSAFGHALTLAQVFTRIAANSDNPDRAYDDVLAGHSAEANGAIKGLLDEATADMPTQYRDRVAAIGKDIAAVARKQAAHAPAAAGSSHDALQARKDLTAMGLRYHDPNDFLDAVKRDDALAVELFIAGRGVNLAARDGQGRSALEIARARGNAPLAQLLAKSLPAAR